MPLSQTSLFSTPRHSRAATRAGPSRQTTFLPSVPKVLFASARGKGKSGASPEESSQESSVASTPSSNASYQSHDYPNDHQLNNGLQFAINWGNLWYDKQRLIPSQIGYQVKHLQGASGKSPTSAI